MHKAQTDRATQPTSVSDSAQPEDGTQPQSVPDLTNTTTEDRPTPAASLSRFNPDNDAFSVGGLDTGFLSQLVHDLQGPTRALSDIPSWLVEDMSEAGLTLPEGCDRLLGLLEENTQNIAAILAGLTRWLAVARRMPECNGCQLGEALADLHAYTELNVVSTAPDLVLPVRHHGYLAISD